MSLRRPAVIFPDVVAAAVDLLDLELSRRPATDLYADEVTVLDRAPEGEWPTRRLVTIRDDGGQRSGPVTKTCALGVNVWAETHADCSDLARLVVALLEDAHGTPFVGHVSTQGPYLVTEDGPKIRRYAVVTLTIQGSAL